MDTDTVVKKTAAVIEEVLNGVGIESKVIEIDLGSAYIKYVIEVSEKSDFKQILNLSSILATYINPPTGLIRLEAPIPGTELVGIEVPKEYLEPVDFDEMWFYYNKSNNNYKLPVLLGVDAKIGRYFKDLVELENILVAGSTGSGKSVFNNVLIWSLILSHSSEELKLVITDAKRVEFSRYNGIPYLTDYVHLDVEDILQSLEQLTKERKKREMVFKNSNVKSLEEYNTTHPDDKLPFIVIIIDTFSDLMMYDSARFENIMSKILPESGKFGMHTIICDSRPSMDVFSPKLQKLFTTRIAFNTSSKEDSMWVLGQAGAEKLLGRGDMLILLPGSVKPLRLQAPNLSDEEIKKLLKDLNN